MLHIVKQFPIDSSVLNRTRVGDTVLFIDNAVLAIKKDHAEQNKLLKALTHLNSCVSKKDLLNRGVSYNDILSKVCIIDEQDLQTITENCTVVRSSN
jgi:sulfur relay protein TusB/DsrH